MGIRICKRDKVFEDFINIKKVQNYGQWSPTNLPCVTYHKRKREGKRKAGIKMNENEMEKTCCCCCCGAFLDFTFYDFKIRSQNPGFRIGIGPETAK